MKAKLIHEHQGEKTFALIFASALVLDRLAAAGRGGLSAVHFAGVGTGIVASAALVATLSDWRAMWFASAALAVAAGDGAFSTCTIRGACSM